MFECTQTEQLKKILIWGIKMVCFYVFLTLGHNLCDLGKRLQWSYGRAYAWSPTCSCVLPLRACSLFRRETPKL